MTISFDPRDLIVGRPIGSPHVRSLLGTGWQFSFSLVSPRRSAERRKSSTGPLLTTSLFFAGLWRIRDRQLTTGVIESSNSLVTGFPNNAQLLIRMRLFSPACLASRWYGAISLGASCASNCPRLVIVLGRHMTVRLAATEPFQYPDAVT